MCEYIVNNDDFPPLYGLCDGREMDVCVCVCRWVGGSRGGGGDDGVGMSGGEEGAQRDARDGEHGGGFGVLCVCVCVCVCVGGIITDAVTDRQIHTPHTHTHTPTSLVETRR